eukprot:TRINITY_DN4498_c0_g1_i1.p2 TRINITY_DN4498_c0_g1~~TRINITY_DN4498_c0_g1_i1.p2  ORF type:complete len:54 (+),score=17.93 TRINITY_DN4498_c0_g1_i1:75-236(+)
MFVSAQDASNCSPALSAQPRKLTSLGTMPASIIGCIGGFISGRSSETAKAHRG